MVKAFRATQENRTTACGIFLKVPSGAAVPSGNVPCLPQSWGAAGDGRAPPLSLGWEQQTAGTQILQGAETRRS